MFLLLATCPAPVYSQITPLPPGTSVPDDGQSATPTNRAAQQVDDLISKAEDAIVRNDYDQALSYLRKVIGSKLANPPQLGRAFYDCGYVEEERNHLPQAEEDYRKAIATDSKQFESHGALGQLFAQKRQWKDARHELEQAATLQPASGDRAEAIATVDRTLAHVDAELRDDSAASEALLAALKLTPEQPDDTLLAAQLAEDQKNYSSAEQEYKKLLASDPKSMAGVEGLARSLIHQQKFSEAEQALQQGLQQEPNNPVLLAESATALANQGKTEDAIQQLESLHKQNPDQPAITRMLADLYSTGGYAADADPLYRQLLAGNPKDPDLLTAAGENLMKEQKWAEAERMFQQSVNLNPQQADTWSDLAFAASENQNYSLVLTALEERARSLADVPATYFLRASALDHLHRYKEAISCYQKFLDTAAGKFPDEEAQTRARLAQLRKPDR